MDVNNCFMFIEAFDECKYAILIKWQTSKKDVKDVYTLCSNILYKVLL